MQKLFWTTAATVILLCGDLNAAAPTRKSMSINQLVANSDMIVSGKITEVKKLFGDPVGFQITQTYEVGLIEVKRMIYGPQEVKRVKIYLSPVGPDDQFKVGDAGTWFLMKYHDEIAKELLNGVFEAEHPSRFWPDDPQWHKRKKGLIQKLSDEQKKKRRQQLHQEVAKRLRAKINLTNKELKLINKELESLKKNLDLVVPVKDKNEP